MKKLARAILQLIINDLPIQQREYGQAMLAELEETNGLQALVWASGGIQLWAQTRGGEIMKNAAFWFGLVAIGILAGGLYVTKGLIWAVPVVAVGVIAFAALRPRDALPVALLLGLSLPIAELLQVWLMARTFMVVTSITREGFPGSITAVISNEGKPMNSVPVPDVSLNFSGKLNLQDRNFITDLSGLSNIPTNDLPHLTVAILLGAIVIAGISAFIRSRVAARNVISQS
jgi:hypothetical protein